MKNVRFKLGALLCWPMVVLAALVYAMPSTWYDQGYYHVGQDCYNSGNSSCIDDTCDDLYGAGTEASSQCKQGALEAQLHHEVSGVWPVKKPISDGH